MKTDPAKIDAAIRATGLTMRELSLRVGCSDTAIANYRFGYRTPSTDRVEALAKALGVSVADLLVTTTNS